MEYKDEKKFFTVLTKFNEYSAFINKNGFTLDLFIEGMHNSITELFPHCKICIYSRKNSNEELSSGMPIQAQPCGVKDLKIFLGNSRRALSGKASQGNPINKNWSRFIIIPVFSSDKLFAVIVVGGKKEHIKPYTETATYISNRFSGELERLIQTENRFKNIVKETKIEFIENARNVLRTRQTNVSWYNEWHDYSETSGCDFSNLYKSAPKIWYEFLCTVTTNTNNRLFVLMAADTTVSILCKKNIPPEEIIKRLQLFVLDRMSDCYISAIITRYNKETNQIETAGAGDCVLFKFKHDTQQISQIFFGDTLGHGSDRKIHTINSGVEPGDILCTFSDGITTAQKQNGGMLGSDAVRAELLKCSSMSTKSISSKTGSLVQEYCLSKGKYDDRSLQIIKFE